MSLAGGDLTTLAALQGYIASAPSSTVMSGLITRVSRLVLTQLNRPLLVPKLYVQQFNGQGTFSLVLPNWPVLSISSILISGASIPLATQENNVNDVSYGYRTPEWDGIPPGDPAVLGLVGGAYLYRGGQNVVVTYRAGYQVTDEVATVPASTPFTVAPLAPYGSWATDEGVTYDNGVALTAISSGTPTAGQYLPPAPDAATPRTTYLFNAADAGRGVLLSYGFIPADVEQAVLEFIADRAAYRTRPGIRSQMLAAQETISYDLRGLSHFVDEALMGYKSVLPPAIGANA